MKDTIPQAIIRFIESKGEASKSQIEDHLKELQGTLGETTGRRMRELIEEGVLVKVKKRFEDKDYYTYKVIELSPDLFADTLKI